MGGRSQVVGPSGEVLAEAGADEQVLSVEVDVDGLDAVRAAFPVLADRRL
jgi:predicted amidohydrolase